MAYPQLTFSHTSFAPDSFIGRKRKVVFENTIPYQLQVLKETGTYDAFKLKWRDSYKPDPQFWIPSDFHLFWDSDLGKWIEGACYSLHERKDEEVEKAVRELVEMIRDAQQEDGYLNIHYTVVEPEKRWSNLRDMHELYNAGHLIEAAIAHSQLFENDRLLEPMLKYVDLISKTFGPGKDQLHGYPGHSEIELALLRLHSVTKNPKHLALTRYFIDERGNPKGADGKHFYDWEAERRGERPYERPDCYLRRGSLWYQMAHIPIVDQDKIRGHAVRAMYLLTGVADLQRKRETENVQEGKDYAKALKTLWTNMVEKKMYVTGGIGARGEWEGFGIDYFLPQSWDEGGCYAETCAAIGVMMLAQRLLQIELDVQYADIMELCFYNAVLGGMSCDGKSFAYANPLASCDDAPCKREKWFTCACCPPNAARLLASIGGYLWNFEIDESNKSAIITVHMFASATLTFSVGNKDVKLKQTVDSPNLPWGNSVEFVLEAPEDVDVFINLRIPGWADEWKLNPAPLTTNTTKGYLRLNQNWLKENPRFQMSIDTKVRFLSPHPYTNQNTVTLAKGPLIYCVEDVDNKWVDDHFKSLLFDQSRAELSETEKYDEETGDPYLGITAKGGCSFLVGVENLRGTPGMSPGSLNTSEKRQVEELHFVPFYYRANRGGKGHMRVGLRKA